MVFEWPKNEEITYIRPPKEFYKGKLKNYYSSILFPELDILKENWEIIRDEVVDFEKRNGKINQMDSFSPANIEGNNWSTIFLKNFMWNFYHNMKKFPATSSIIEKIPNCTYAVISVLAPYTSIKPHYGDTNGVLRVHLGLSIPGKYPDLGIRVEGEDNCWENGQIICYPDIKKHEVWNNTPHTRYILVLDIVPQPLWKRKFEICKTTLGNQSYIFFYNRFKLARILPYFIQSTISFVFSQLWGIYLIIQSLIDDFVKKIIFNQNES